MDGGRSHAKGNMKVLLLGVGAVGEAIAKVAGERPWLERMVLADLDLERVRKVQSKLGDPEKFPAEQLDASNGDAINALIKKYNIDLLMNATRVELINTVFDAAFNARCNYMDMAMSGVAEKMGEYTLGRFDEWERAGRIAILGMGMDPGISDIFARYAQDHLFDEIDEIGIRDGAALTAEGYDFFPTFSIYDTVDECTDPALVWEKERGWYEVSPFSEPESFEFPGGIGRLTVVNVEHEEVALIPRYIKCKRVTFKYGLDETFLKVMQVIKLLGLYQTKPIDVKGQKVIPVDVIAALVPNPAEVGDRMRGKTCVGTYVTGTRNGQMRKIYLYQITDNQESMKKYGLQAVSVQTGIPPVIAMELLAERKWTGSGVFGPEAFDAVPFLGKMEHFDFPYNMMEMA
jgi:saccharopine dehydrogenase-like NADP-dependent oxidoreductase